MLLDCRESDKTANSLLENDDDGYTRLENAVDRTNLSEVIGEFLQNFLR